MFAVSIESDNPRPVMACLRERSLPVLKKNLGDDMGSLAYSVGYSAILRRFLI